MSVIKQEAAEMPPSLPLLASTVTFGRDPIGFFVKSYRRYGPVFRLRAFDFNLTVMLGARAHRAIFVDQAEKLSVRSGYRLLLSVMNDALLLADGERHAQQKRLVQPAFHVRRIERYVEFMHRAAERRMATWRDGMVVDVYEEARRMTLEVIMQVLTGADISAEYDAFARTLTYTFDYATKPNIQKWVRLDLPFTQYRRNRLARRQLDSMLYTMIARRRAEGGHGDDVLSWLIAARDADGSALSDAQVRDQVLLLIYAGHDTATCSLAWALHLLGCHPEALGAIEQELKRFGDSSRIGMAELADLVQLGMAIDETLRLYPPVWIGLRGVEADFEFNEWRIPAGSSLMYSAAASHRLPEVFPDPLRFDPQRFAPERKARLDPFSYIPFGGGAHMCVGKPLAQVELKVLLARLLSAWRFEPLHCGPVPMHYNPTLAPKHGLPMRLRRLR